MVYAFGISLLLASGAAAQKTSLPSLVKGALLHTATPAPALLFPILPTTLMPIEPTMPQASADLAPLAVVDPIEPKRSPRWSPPRDGYFADYSIPKNERLERFVEMTTRFWDVKDLVSPESAETFSAYLERTASPRSPLKRWLTPKPVREAARHELERLQRLLPAEKDTAVAMARFKNAFSPDYREQGTLKKTSGFYTALAEESTGPADGAFASYLRRKIAYIGKQISFKGAFYDRVLNLNPAEPPDLSAYAEAVKVGLAARTPVDYASFFRDNRVLLIGETHQVKSHRREILEHLVELRAAGVTHIFLEGVSPQRQEWLDHITEKREREYNSVGTLAVEAPERARALGLKVIAMDMPANTIGALNAAAQKRGDHVAAEREVYVLRRNRYMAQMLAKTLRREPNSKIVAIVGAVHSDALGSPALLAQQQTTSITAELRRHHGVSSKTARLVDATDATGDHDATVAGQISESRLVTQRFYIPLGPDGGILHVGY